MHSFHGKSATFHYDSGLMGDIIIIDKDNNKVRFDARDLLDLIEKEKSKIEDDELEVNYECIDKDIK